MSKVICLVDNAARRSTPFWAEHGLSLWIEHRGKRVLFDTGQSGLVLAHNLEVRGLSLATLDAMALSHAHYDHTGGLDFVLDAHPGLAVYAHRDLLQRRYSLREGVYRSIGMALSPAETRARCDLRLSADPQEIVPGLWNSGEIRERPEAEGRSSHHFVRQGETWLADPYRDDLSLVLEVSGGVVLVCGCCHAGLLNTLAHVRRTFQRPIVAVLGGTHLSPLAGESLRHVVEVLEREYGAMHYYLNHCTGEKALATLWGAFGEQRVHAFPAGSEITFEGRQVA